MRDRIVIGKQGNEHGLWVKKPNNAVPEGGQYILSSAVDMLKIHAQGSVASFGIRQSDGMWRHEIEVSFPELPYIPLAFMGLKTSDAEPFQFPPDLFGLMTYTSFPSTGIVNYIPPVGISHNKLAFKGWVNPFECKFNYTVFIVKLRDKF